MKVVEIKILWCMYDVIRINKIRNEYVKESLDTTNIPCKIKNRLRWCGHIKRRNNDNIVKIGEIRIDRIEEKVGQKSEWGLLGKIWELWNT